MLSKAEKLQTFNDKIIDFIFKRFGDSIKATLNLNSDEVEYQKKEVRNLIKEYGIKYIFK